MNELNSSFMVNLCMVPRETVSLFPNSLDVSRDKFEGNMKTLEKTKLTSFQRDHT